MNIGFGITGSFCTHEQILKPLQNLVDKGHNVVPIITESVLKTNTRFGNAKEFLNKLEDITKNKVVSTIVDAEPLGPKKIIDMLVIAPCTGNTLSKLAHAITDSAVTMTAKALMRNNKQIIIALASNDALGFNLHNIATLLNSKNIYFVPFKQDDPINKPKSLIADFSKIEDTILLSVQNKQIQPLFI